MQPYTVIFMGPQGSGKGTQLEKLEVVLRGRTDARDVVVIQTGRLFRALARAHNTYTGERLRETLDTGMLQPNFLTTGLWGQVMIERVTPECHILIDGFPRTLEQAHVLDGAFHFYARKEIIVVNLTAPDELVRARMQERARADDTEAAIAERLRLYSAETLPVLDFYRARAHTNVLDIDGTVSVEEVHTAIVQALGLDGEAYDSGTHSLPA